MRITRSIRARVTATAVLIVAIVLGVSGFAASWIISTTLHEQVENSLSQDLENLGDQVEENPNTLDSYDEGMLARLDGSSTIINDDEAADLPQVSARTRVIVDGEAYLADSAETDAGTLTVARPLDQVEEAVSTTNTLLVIGIPLVVLLIFLVVWVVTGRALAPVETLRQQVDAIGPQDLTRRVDSGADELGALAATMNHMLDRLERAQKTQNQFVSDASHELRSPLATIRQHAELASRYPEATSLETLSDTVLQEGTRMQQLVEGLLLLAKLDEGQRYTSELLDVDDLLFQEARRLRQLGLAVDSSEVHPARFNGNAQLLTTVVRNLGDNAARHASGGILLSLSAEEGKNLKLTVQDDGSGVPEEQREAIFERFARLDESRTRDSGGSGLGLAITKRIIDSYGGTISVDDSPLGGARFTVVLPGS